MSSAAPIVLFDFDGVITRRDTFGAFVTRRLVASPWRIAAALPLLPLLAVPPLWKTGVRWLSALALAGLDEEAYAAEAQAFARALAARPRALLADGIAAALGHVRAGDRVVVVTACEERLARAVLDAAGLEQVGLVGSRIRVDGRRPDLVEHTIGSAKPRALRARGIEPPWAVAYSDSIRDVPMLAGARQAVLVNVGRRERAAIERRLAAPVRSVRWR